MRFAPLGLKSQGMFPFYASCLSIGLLQALLGRVELGPACWWAMSLTGPVPRGLDMGHHDHHHHHACMHSMQFVRSLQRQTLLSWARRVPEQEREATSRHTETDRLLLEEEDEEENEGGVDRLGRPKKERQRERLRSFLEGIGTDTTWLLPSFLYAFVLASLGPTIGF